MSLRILCRPVQPEPEALQAAASPFRFTFKAFDSLKPPGMVTVIIQHHIYTERSGIAETFVPAAEEFLLRIDVGIAVIDCRSDAAAHQTFYDG